MANYYPAQQLPQGAGYPPQYPQSEAHGHQIKQSQQQQIPAQYHHQQQQQQYPAQYLQQQQHQYANAHQPQQPPPQYSARTSQPHRQQQVAHHPTTGSNSNCPPGLEYLAHLDQLVVKQKIEAMEIFTGFEMKNKYKIMNSMGQDIFKAKEDTDCLTRQCCGPMRPFDMNIVDNFEREVIHLYRTFCYPEFLVCDANGNAHFKIEGPLCQISCCGDVEFNIFTADGSTEIGLITKQWTGFVREAFTDADNFSVTFPRTLDIKMKATLLGALFLIDFMFFEKKQN